MNHTEKAELMKSAITHLYCKEGRSKSYIEKLLGINRGVISRKINEWQLPEPAPNYYMKPSTRKQINRNRQLIKSMLDKDYSITSISKKIDVSRKVLTSIWFKYDEVLSKAYLDWRNRRELNIAINNQKAKDLSSRRYDIKDMPNEKWKNILGFSKYMVSNYGRVKRWSQRRKDFYLISAFPNKNNGGLYVSLVSDNNETKNLNLSRVIAQTFIPHDEACNTVNHIDGDITNNKASNLEWLTQGENNKHAYKALNRTKNRGKRYKFDYILYKGKYQFKTVAAFARFIGKSETQTRRYIDNAEKHDIKLMYNCID